MILAARLCSTTVALTAAPASTGAPVATSAPSPIISTSSRSMTVPGSPASFSTAMTSSLATLYCLPPVLITANMVSADMGCRARDATVGRTPERGGPVCRPRDAHYRSAQRAVNRKRAGLPQGIAAIADWVSRARHLAIAMLVSLVAGIGGTASADELALPKTVERDSQITAAYRFDKPATGRGFLDVEWTDVAGREVERRHIPLDLVDASQVAFQLDMRRAVTAKNGLSARLSLDGVARGGATVQHRGHQVASFIASPPAQRWWDYQIIMWQGQTPAAYASLKRLGLTGGMLSADHRSEGGTYMAAELTPLLDQDLRFYLENIATDFYSPYHRWSEGRPVNWRFLAVEALHRQRPDDIAAFIRDPSLSDPDWLAKVHARLTRDVLALKGYRPLYYSLGDETGIAELTRF